MNPRRRTILVWAATLAVGACSTSRGPGPSSGPGGACAVRVVNNTQESLALSYTVGDRQEPLGEANPGQARDVEVPCATGRFTASGSSLGMGTRRYRQAMRLTPGRTTVVRLTASDIVR